MSVATASPASATPPPPPSPPKARPPPRTAAPTHSILRPCDKNGLPIGPPIIAAPPGAVSHAPPEAALAPKETLVTTVSVAPSSPTTSHVTGNSSTDSLGAPSMSTGLSSPPLSATSTAACQEYASSDVYETDSVASSSVRGRGGPSTARSSTMSPSPKIRFGNCPERPPELRRRNSITLGVLARKNMLQAQGTVRSNGMNKVYMTDAEWEAYQQKFQKNTHAAPIDIGAVMSSGAKNFWRKVRRGSNASVTSNASISSSASVPNPRVRSDSSSSVSGGSGLVPPNVAPAAPVIHEEDEPHSAPSSPRKCALQMSTVDGDATPGRRRSPSPVPLGDAVYDDEEMDPDFFSIGSPKSATSAGADSAGISDEEAKTPCDNDDLHGRDDAQAEYDSRRGTSRAALGFEISDYDKRPTWGRRGTGGSIQDAVPIQEHPRII